MRELHWIYITIGLVSISVASTSKCNFGPTCPFPCRCASSRSQCNSLTGSCPDGCAISRPQIPQLRGWSGPGCQTGNIAQGQLAWQYGQFRDWGPERSVNGRIHRTGDDYSDYSHPAGPGQGWWTVDLGKLHKVYSVIYANTAEVSSFNYSTSMKFYVGNTPIPKKNITIESLLPSYTLCGSRDRIGRSENAVINCQIPILGRYIVVYKASRYVPGSFVMAEVMVNGHVYVPCDGCTSTCNPKYGCIADCPPGKTQDTFCAEDCPEGKYGPKCTETCSGHCARNRNRCNSANGGCDRGCETWWSGLKCDTPIIDLGSSSFQGEITGDSTSSTITVTWDHLSNIPPSLASHYAYKVTYSSALFHTVNYSATQYKATHTVQHLNFNEFYTINVVPCRKDRSNLQFYEDLKKSIRIKTKCKPPDKPTLLSVEAVNVSSSDESYILEAARATFKLGKESNCDDFDAVYIEYNTSSSDWESEGVSPAESSGVVEPYYPGWYAIRVKVRNNELLTAVSDPLTVYLEDYGERPVSAAVIGGMVVGVILFFLLCIIICVCCRRKKSKSRDISTKRRERQLTDHENNYKKSDIVLLKEVTEIPEVSDDEPYCDDIPEEDDELELEPHELAKGDQIYENNLSALETIPLEHLADRLVELESQDGGLEAEMMMLPGPEHAVADVGQYPENKNKNRFSNIIPFDHSRVVFEPDDQFDSDYINANYITGYSDAKQRYIATQGPRPNTLTDFWRMIWELQVDTIVMLTPLVDNKKRQSEQYWPKSTGESMAYGPFQVCLEAEKVCADYIVRHMQLYAKGKHMKVNQFHYLAWPDRHVPAKSFALFAFLSRIKNELSSDNKPWVVHCSAGVGRTGTFIALDILLNQALAEDAVSVYGCVHGLRTERLRMVQTLSQYRFLYHALIDFAKTGKTSTASSEFPARYTALLTPLLGDQTPLSEQYSLLRSLVKEDKLRISVGLLQENKSKNRYENFVPPDVNLPRLRTPYKYGNSYINACFVNSPECQKGFITTQTPLPDTMVDFWRLVYDLKVSTIVMLNVLDQRDCPQYWPGPTDPDMYGGPFCIRLEVEEKVNSHITKRELYLTRIRQGDSVPVTLIQLVSDSDDHDGLPDTGDLLDLLDKMDLTQTQNKKTVVVCKDGVMRSGLFCAACHIINRIKAEQDVDVFLASRLVATHNHHFINKFKQYKYLHDLVITFMSRFDIYAS